MENELEAVVDVLPRRATLCAPEIAERERSIEERQWAETRLAGEKRLLEMIALGRPLRDVLEALCGFVEEAAPGCLCGVYPIDWSGPTFQRGVAPSLPASYIDPLDSPTVRRDVAPCGIAAFMKTQVIVEDIALDPSWRASSYAGHVLAHGLRSVWSTPVCSREGRVLGTFRIYNRGPAVPSPRQRDLIAQVSHIASIAIERARSEAALRRSEAFLAEGQRLSSTGTFAWRVDRNEMMWSDETYRIYEIDPGAPPTFEVIGQRVHPENRAHLRDVVASVRAGGGDFDYESRLLMPDGRIKYLHVVAHGGRNQDGEWELIGAVQDVTERRLSEDALGKLRSELAHVARVTSLGALTASIAHEVNQPLSGIITNASTCLRMLAADPPNLNGARETARRTIRDGNRAADVIARLRALFGKQGPTMERFDLNEATREVIALSLSELHRGRVVLRSELAGDLPPVTGDRVQLQQVILNLLRNASEAMRDVDDRVREVMVGTELEDDDSVRLTVRDSGAGFDARGTDRMFEAFYTTKRDGMGIGLSVSRSIIESHRGRLWAAPNDGPGAAFAFSIPRAVEGVPSPRTVAAPRPSAAAGAPQLARTP